MASVAKQRAASAAASWQTSAYAWRQAYRSGMAYVMPARHQAGVAASAASMAYQNGNQWRHHGMAWRNNSGSVMAAYQHRVASIARGWHIMAYQHQRSVGKNNHQQWLVASAAATWQRRRHNTIIVCMARKRKHNRIKRKQNMHNKSGVKSNETGESKSALGMYVAHVVARHGRSA